MVEDYPFQRFLRLFQSTFENGWILDEPMCHFIASTTSFSSLYKLALKNDDELFSEEASLIEYLFSPSQKDHLNFEPLLESASFNQADETRLIMTCFQQRLKTTLHPMTEKATVSIELSKAMIQVFIERLHIGFMVAPDILKRLDRIPAENMRQTVKVMLRKNAMHWTPFHIDFFSLFFDTVDLGDEAFMDLSVYLLSFLAPMKRKEDVWCFLIKRYQTICKVLTKDFKRNMRWKNSNMEIKAAQGLRVPYVNVDHLKKEMDMIQKLGLCLFNRSTTVPDERYVLSHVNTDRKGGLLSCMDI